VRVSAGDLVAIGLIGIVAWWYSEQRPVMIYPSPETAIHVPASPGHIGSITGTLQKLRGDCDAHPTMADTILIDSMGAGHIINQRSGMRLRLPKGSHDVTIEFEVPRLVAPGMGTIEIYQTYECWPFSVRQKSPVYPFEVLTDGE